MEYGIIGLAIVVFIVQMCNVLLFHMVADQIKMITEILKIMGRDINARY